MVKVAYYSLNAPSGEIRYESNGEGLCLVSGTEARSFLDVLELKGSLEYAGMFRVFESDLLDINNANRDRYPVSVIRAQDQNFLVQRSQVPLGGSLDTSKIDKLVESYLNDRDLKANETPNFRNLFRSIYCELVANTKYIVLELLGNDKDFSFCVLDFAAKTFPTRSIFLYAPLLTPEDTRTIALTFHFEEILNPVEHNPNQERERRKTEIQMTFIRDLRGRETDSLPEKKRPTIGMNDFEIDGSKESKEEERGLLAFGENAGLVQMILVFAFAGVSLILAILNALFIGKPFLWLVFSILSIGALGMQLLSLSVLHRGGDAKEKHQSHEMSALFAASGNSLFAFVFVGALGIIRGFVPWYSYLLFLILHFGFFTLILVKVIHALIKSKHVHSK
ncbi:MAG: hypothetical protein J5736_00530 [Bacilli bacterium]|nr:hypothetical protein [Bacilli bacterium]